MLRSADGQGPDRKIIVQYGGRNRPAKYEASSVLWNEWRLVGERELYNIASDPGQQSEIADRHPEIAQTLKAHYDGYWASIEESVEIVEPLVVRGGPGTSTDLTSNGWIEVDCENRTRVAEACGPPRGGLWQIEVEESGSYQVELARWPFHLDRELVIAGPGATIGGSLIERGKALPIANASLSLNGGPPLSADAAAGAKSVSFEIALEQGRSTLRGWFGDASGTDLVGAYYGRVRRQ